MLTTLTFTKENRDHYEDEGGGKIKVIQAIRGAFGLGLRDSKIVADALWELNCYRNTEFPPAVKEWENTLRKYGIEVNQPNKTIPIRTRVLQVVKAAIAKDECQLAEDLLRAYNKRF